MARVFTPALTRNLLVLDTREAILDLAPLLQVLALRCGQPGAMHWLPYFLHSAVVGQKSPYLVLQLRPEPDGEAERSLSADDLVGAALLFEYKVFGFRTGAFATGDAVGFNSVIAPPGQRAMMAATAARALLEHGAEAVVATYEGYRDMHSRTLMANMPEVVSADRQRRVERTLRLCPTLEQTLSSMGKSTRANFRRYRRRLERKMACEYVADAAHDLQGADLEAINRTSLNPIEPDEFRRRVTAATELSGSFLSGLRAPDGRWLALMGGWRQGGTTVLQWQVNGSGYESYSIGTVARSYLLEHEIERGAETLMLYGGTPHSMRHAFEVQPVADLVVRRKTLRAGLLRVAVHSLTMCSGVLRRGNFFASTLCDKDLSWVPSRPVAGMRRAPVLHPQS